MTCPSTRWRCPEKRNSSEREHSHRMLLYRTRNGLIVSDRPGGSRILLPDRSWDDVFASIITKRELSDMFSSAKGAGSADPMSDRELLPPIGSQEVWAAGVTYLRSRTARMEE